MISESGTGAVSVCAIERGTGGGSMDWVTLSQKKVKQAACVARPGQVR